MMGPHAEMFTQIVLSHAGLLLAMCMSLGLPFAVFALGASQVRWRDKACVLIAYLAGILILSQTGEDVVTWLLIQVIALGCLALCACCVCLLALTGCEFKGVVSWSVFAVLMAAFTLAPRSLVPTLASVAMASASWELALSSHSYLSDAYDRGHRPPMSAGLFFLLVNPCLVWQERGAMRRRPRGRATDLSRCALGAGAIAVHFAALWACANLSLTTDTLLPTRAAAPGILGFIGYYALRFLAGYAAHSGVASLKIGMMGLLGYDVPERYNYPWLAKDPADFWRRWNTYIGAWAKRYVFWPLAKALQRRATTSSWNLAARGTAVLATFVLIGLLHDYAVFARDHRWPLGGVFVFGLNGLALIAWRVSEDAVLGFGRGLRLSTAALHSNIWSAVSRTGFVPFLLLTVWIAIPTMSADSALTLDTLARWFATMVRP